MTYLIIGVLTGLLLLLAAAFFLGIKVGDDRRQDRRDLQAALDRTAREQWETHLLTPRPYGRFPVDTGPMFRVDSEISAEGDATLREVREHAAEAERLWRLGMSQIGPTP